jgi:hypothetical protein
MTRFDRGLGIARNVKQHVLMTEERLLAPPHSTSGSCDFDRALECLRADIAELFTTSVLHYSIVLASSREHALEIVAEGYPGLLIVDSSMGVSAAFITALSRFSVGKDSSRKVVCVDAAGREPRPRGGPVLVQCSTPFALPNLSEEKCDFALCDLREMCCVPLTCLLIRAEVLQQMSCGFLGGGTAAFVCARSLTHRPLRSAARFEGGTLPQLTILGARAGVAALRAVLRFLDRGTFASLLCRLHEELEGCGCAVELLSGCGCVVLKCREAPRLHASLAAMAIDVGLGDNCLILAPEFSVTASDITRLVQGICDVWSS